MACKNKKPNIPSPAADMGTSSPSAQEEVGTLLEDAIVAQAGAVVWEKFEKALSQLDGRSVELLERYLDGVSLEELSKERNLSKKEVADWIAQLKREMMQVLRKECRLKH